MGWEAVSQSGSRLALASALRSAPEAQSALRSAPEARLALRSAPTLGLSSGAVSPLDAADAPLAAVVASNCLTAARLAEHVSLLVAASLLVTACWSAAAYLSAAPRLAASSASALAMGAASPLVIARASQSAPGRCLRLAQSDRALAMGEADDWSAAALQWGWQHRPVQARARSEELPLLPGLPRVQLLALRPALSAAMRAQTTQPLSEAATLLVQSLRRSVPGRFREAERRPALLTPAATERFAPHREAQ